MWYSFNVVSEPPALLWCMRLPPFVPYVKLSMRMCM
jgi:hypothetical protein